MVFGGFAQDTYLCKNKGLRLIGMLGINTPKIQAKGEYAKAVRAAVSASAKAAKNGRITRKRTKTDYQFDWKL